VATPRTISGTAVARAPRGTAAQGGASGPPPPSPPQDHRQPRHGAPHRQQLVETLPSPLPVGHVRQHLAHDAVAVTSLATPPAQVAGLPVIFPIPSPGWVQRIPVPQWPPDLAAHMSPSGVTNQCVAGALETWAMMHPADPRWNHPPALFGNAIDLVGVAQAEGFQLDNDPTPGAMVVYGSAYGVFGHIGTVRGPGRPLRGRRAELPRLRPQPRAALADLRPAVGGLAGSGGGRVCRGAAGTVRAAPARRV
jgi:hypothetical protein